MMQITINTDNLSELDIKILDFLLDEVSDPAETEATPPVVEPKKATAVAKKTEAAPVAEPEPEEDLLGGSAPTMSDAVAAATQLVSSGSAAKVKEALSGLDVKRVSELKDDQIPAFLAALA